MPRSSPEDVTLVECCSCFKGVEPSKAVRCGICAKFMHHACSIGPITVRKAPNNTLVHKIVCSKCTEEEVKKL